jgi:L,D-transpeptidase catalytic domain
MNFESLSKICSSLSIKPTERVLFVRISDATMQFYNQGKLVRSYGISTSKKPPSNIKNSLGTPRGLHEIAERIGAGQPPGMVFISRAPTGMHYSEVKEVDNMITSRIMWLRGLEPGVNQGGEVDTYSRYIYIHGTNHDDKVGEPLSAGCVVMRNLDIVQLYEEVRAGDMVWIVD